MSTSTPLGSPLSDTDLQTVEQWPAPVPFELGPDDEVILERAAAYEATAPAQPEAEAGRSPSTPLETFLGLRGRILALQAELNDLKPVILRHLRATGGRVQHDDKEILIGVRRSWTFSAATRDQVAALRERKQAEIEDGTATLRRETPFVMVRRQRRAP